MVYNHVKMNTSKRIAEISKKLIGLFSVIAQENTSVNYVHDSKLSVPTLAGNILDVTDNIAIPGVDMSASFWDYMSPLPDDFLSDIQFSQIIRTINEMGGCMRLNHIGFCYPVESLDNEHTRLSLSISKTKWKLYKEDDSEFRFMGDTSVWDDPMIEFVPVVNKKDQWVNYWLPHIQIDFDTYLMEDEINHLASTISEGRIKPYKLVVVNSQTMIVRLWLGTYLGMNFYLDLGTEGRMTRFYRTRMLNEV